MAAIFYHPEAYATTGVKLMGRHAAGEAFLRAHLQFSNTSEFWIFLDDRRHAASFEQVVRRFGRSEPVRPVTAVEQGLLARAGSVYLPGPCLAEQAWKRARFGHGSWSLCGITHTTCTDRTMDGLAELLTVPVQPWDAVICTSQAVKANVVAILQAQEAYLRDRLGITRTIWPQLPVIPLGIHAQDFSFTSDQRLAARHSIEAGEDTLVVLYMGRLSFHAKAHPLAMYQALERAAVATDREVVLVECGWHANAYIQQTYEAAARVACPSVRVITLDGRVPEQRATAWACADVFCSLSDNIQETFGIVPIEGMAAGLPVVVSDWDGYRDTVRHEVDGFRISTVMPQTGADDLIGRYALGVDTYDRYLGHTSSSIVVDVEAAAQAFIRLFDSRELREAMGQSGRNQVRRHFDWSVVYAQYEQLWAELAEIRSSLAAASNPLAHPWPARMDPFEAFAAYPTQRLGPQTVVALPAAGLEAAEQWLRSCLSLSMVTYASSVLLTEAEALALLQRLAAAPLPIARLTGTAASPEASRLLRGVAWLLKLGVLRLLP